MFEGQSLSVVLPAFNEVQNIRTSIEHFLAHPAVDEVIAVDNRSTDGTKEAILATRAKYVFEARQGFGAALMKGLEESTGDLIVQSEPDGTFAAGDLDKLLLYQREFDVVFGTRTSKSCIWSGAHMPWLLRTGNWIVAKLLQFLHNGPSLTDVGCTYRLLKRPVYREIRPHLRVQGSHFNVDMMILAIRMKAKCVEIPVHYGPRIGESKITGDNLRALAVGLRMILLILRYRLRSFR